MTWVRLDDQFPFHPKVLNAGKDGRALYVVGLCYAAQHETDGAIPAVALPMLLATAEVPRRTVRALLDAGLWHEVDPPRPTMYLIHDFLAYNPSRASLQAERDAGARRQKASRDRRKDAGVSHAVTPPVTNGVSHAGASGDPIPIPYPSSYPSSTTTVEPRPGPDDGTILEQACRTLAEREAAQRSDIASVSGWVRARAASLVREHADAAHQVLEREPATTAGQLVAYLDGSRSAVPDPVTYAVTLARNVASADSDPDDWLPKLPECAHDAFRQAWIAALGGAA